MATDEAALIKSLRALEHEAAYRVCSELSAVYVRGDDRISWLNGQVTGDVRGVSPGHSVHVLAVNVRGKILAELYVTALADALLLLLPRSAEAALLESFERYIIMEDVSLERAPALEALYVDGSLAEPPRSAELIDFDCAMLGRPGRMFVGDKAPLQALAGQLEAKIPLLDEALLEIVRLRRAIPRFGVDFDDQNYPQEVGLKALVSFQKGCYLGQEVVCTLENRGKLARHLCVIEGAPGIRISAVDPASGTAAEARAPLHLTHAAAGAEPAGFVTSAAWDPERNCCRMLGYLRRAHAKPGTQLSMNTHALTVVSVVGELDAAHASA